MLKQFGDSYFKLLIMSFAMVMEKMSLFHYNLAKGYTFQFAFITIVALFGSYNYV